MKIEIAYNGEFVGTLGPEKGKFHVYRAGAIVSWSGDEPSQRQVNVSSLDTGCTEGVGINQGECYIFPIDEKYVGPNLFGPETVVRNELQITGI